MLFVKLTILLIVLTIIYAYVLKLTIRSQPIETKIQFAARNYPKWYNNSCQIGGVMMLLDIIGIIYTVIYFLFLR